ncbi:MAG: sigma-70 family RNA polymerase sigma factor [Planctomycetes bacterium]|jgi:RNA polymerase sigma-70 factor (subfamily 1)|nr:sigma-70 family RNA polymerase sigma factor [Planctomycetota bacterium]
MAATDPDHPPEPTPPEEEFALPPGFETPDTADLVRRAQAGDVDALNALFARYHSQMVEIARRRIGPKLRRKEDPDDLAQTTFREATRDFKNYEYRGEGSLVRWLVHILQNKIRDKAEFYSAGKRNTSLETALDAPLDRRSGDSKGMEPEAPDLSVTRQVQRGERFEILRKALVELSPEYREAITLVFFQGLSLREAGQRMGGRSEDALRMLLRRAEAKLRDILKTPLGKDPL